MINFYEFPFDSFHINKSDDSEFNQYAYRVRFNTECVFLASTISLYECVSVCGKNIKFHHVSSILVVYVLFALIDFDCEWK